MQFEAYVLNPRDQDQVATFIHQVFTSDDTITMIEGTVGVGKSTLVECLISVAEEFKHEDKILCVAEPVDKFTHIIEAFYQGKLDPATTSQEIKYICRNEILTACVAYRNNRIRSPRPPTPRSGVAITGAAHDEADSINDTVKSAISQCRAGKMLVERIPETRSWIFSQTASTNDINVVDTVPVGDIYSELVRFYGYYKTLRIVLLEDDYDTIMSNISKRGRECERDISRKYVECIGQRTRKMVESLNEYINGTTELKKYV